jgi:hypothetical protein
MLYTKIITTVLMMMMAAAASAYGDDEQQASQLEKLGRMNLSHSSCSFMLLLPTTTTKQQDRSLRAGGNNKKKNNNNNAPCGMLDQCYLFNIDSGHKVSLSDHGALMMDNPNDRHTILCDTKGNIDEVQFTYNGQVHIESVPPFSMAGDIKDVTHNVPYLTTLGEKEITVTGKNRNGDVCFAETFAYGVYPDQSDHDRHRDLLSIEVEVCIWIVCVEIRIL